MNILITGAKSGIGYATALALLKKDHMVYLTVHTNSQLDEIEKNEELKGLNVKLLKLDITSEEDRKNIRDLDIDVLINNAAIGEGGSIIEADIDRIRENYEVNIFGTIQTTQLFLEKMVKRDNGRIVMISSMIGDMPFPWLGIYSSTKAALTNLSIALDKELKEIHSKVKVVIIEPGLYKTGFNQVMLDNKYDNPITIFKKYKEKIRTKERIKFNLLEKKDLKSIVDKIVESVESKEPELIYKAPFIQAVAQKISIIKNK